MSQTRNWIHQLFDEILRNEAVIYNNGASFEKIVKEFLKLVNEKFLCVYDVPHRKHYTHHSVP